MENTLILSKHFAIIALAAALAYGATLLAVRFQDLAVDVQTTNTSIQAMNACNGGILITEKKGK